MQALKGGAHELLLPIPAAMLTGIVTWLLRPLLKRLLDTVAGKEDVHHLDSITAPHSTVASHGKYVVSAPDKNVLSNATNTSFIAVWNVGYSEGRKGSKFSPATNPYTDRDQLLYLAWQEGWLYGARQYQIDNKTIRPQNNKRKKEQ